MMYFRVIFVDSVLGFNNCEILVNSTLTITKITKFYSYKIEKAINFLLSFPLN